MHINFYNILRNKEHNATKAPYSPTSIIFVLPDNSSIVEYESFLTKVADSLAGSVKATTVFVTYDSFCQQKDALHGLKFGLIIGFGLTARMLELQVDDQRYALRTVGKLHFIFADTVEEIAANKALKLQLWNSLKTLEL